MYYSVSMCVEKPNKNMEQYNVKIIYAKLPSFLKLRRKLNYKTQAHSVCNRVDTVSVTTCSERGNFAQAHSDRVAIATLSGQSPFF